MKYGVWIVVLGSLLLLPMMTAQAAKGGNGGGGGGKPGGGGGSGLPQEELVFVARRDGSTCINCGYDVYTALADGKIVCFDQK